MIVSSKLQAGFIAFAVFLISGVIAFAVPPQRRTVIKVSRPDEPVEIVAINARAKRSSLANRFRGKMIGRAAFLLSLKIIQPNWFHGYGWL